MENQQATDQNSCQHCRQKKSQHECASCHDKICKSCTDFLSDKAFFYQAHKPFTAEQKSFCSSCFTSQVQPLLSDYEELLEKARQILVFDKTQGKETRLIKRIEKPFHVKDCADAEEGTMRIAFHAAQHGYNAVVDVDLKPQKVKMGSYQTTIWSGSGVPTQVSDHKLVKDRSIWQNPN